MNKLILGMATAAMLACALPTAGFAQTTSVPAPTSSAFVEAHSSELVEIPAKAPGASLVFLYGNDCPSCASIEAALSAQKSKFPQFTFVKGNGQQEVGMRPSDLPVMHLMIGEDIITTFDHFAITPVHAEAFLSECLKLIAAVANERIEVFTARDALHRFRDEYGRRYAAIKLDGDRSVKEIDAQLEAARARNAREDEIHQLEAQKNASVLATAAVLKALLDGTDNAFKPLADPLHAAEAALYARGLQLRAPLEKLLSK
jgi:hypothetical protein